MWLDFLRVKPSSMASLEAHFIRVGLCVVATSTVARGAHGALLGCLGGEGGGLMLTSPRSSSHDISPPNNPVKEELL